MKLKNSLLAWAILVLLLGVIVFRYKKDDIQPNYGVDLADIEAEATMQADSVLPLAVRVENATASTKVVKTDTPRVVPPTPNVNQASKEREPSLTVLDKGVLGEGWENNSWNVSFSTSVQDGVIVTYKEPWGGFSYFSKGVDLSHSSSIEVVLGAGTDVSVIKSLKLAIYRGKVEIGTIPMYPYLLSNTLAPTFSIPLSDFVAPHAQVTDMYIMSAVPQQVRFSKIGFSNITAPSQRSVWDGSAGVPSSPQVEVAQPTLSPAIDGLSHPSIYYTGLQNGWNAEGRKGLVIVNEGDESQSVTGKAIKMKYTEKDGLLILSNSKGLSTKGMKSLQLKIYGGTLDYGWQQLNITLRDRSGALLGKKDNIMEFSGNGILRSRTWNEITLPLNALSATNVDIGSIEIGNFNTTLEGDYLWVDAVRLLEN